jgi:hypothetical protein
LVIREQDRSRRHGTDDTVQCDARSIKALATLHASRALRWHTQSTWGNTGTPTGAEARGRVGIHAPALSGRNARGLRFQRNRRIAPVTPVRRSSNGIEYAAGAARTIRSMPCSAGSMSWRTISRRRRLSRFRSTAVCPCRGTMMPTLGNERGEAQTRIEKCRVRTTFPSS